MVNLQTSQTFLKCPILKLPQAALIYYNADGVGHHDTENCDHDTDYCCPITQINAQGK